VPLRSCGQIRSSVVVDGHSRVPVESRGPASPGMTLGLPTALDLQEASLGSRGPRCMGSTAWISGRRPPPAAAGPAQASCPRLPSSPDDHDRCGPHPVLVQPDHARGAGPGVWPCPCGERGREQLGRRGGGRRRCRRWADESRRFVEGQHGEPGCGLSRMDWAGD